MKIASVLKKARIHLILLNLTWLTISQKAVPLFNHNYSYATSSYGHINHFGNGPKSKSFMWKTTTFETSENIFPQKHFDVFKKKKKKTGAHLLNIIARYPETKYGSFLLLQLLM